MSKKKRTLNDFWEPEKKKLKTSSKSKRLNDDGGSDNTHSSKNVDKENLSSSLSDIEDTKENKENDFVVFDNMDIATIKKLVLKKYPKLAKFDNVNYKTPFKVYNLDNQDSQMFECQTYLNDNKFTKDLFDELMKLDFEQSEIKIYGKVIPIPRVQSWMANQDVKNSESSLFQTQAAQPWSEKMYFIKKMLESELNCEFNYCLINLYRNGSDYTAWHADKEAIEKGKDIVASLSLGQTRKFGVRHKNYKEYQTNNKNSSKNKDKENDNSNAHNGSNDNSNKKSKVKNKLRDEKFQWKYEIMLKDGCLIVMRGNMQKYWKHTITKTKKAMYNNPRINLTFRCNKAFDQDGNEIKNVKLKNKPKNKSKTKTKTKDTLIKDNTK